MRFEVGPLSTTRDSLGAIGITRDVAVVTNPPWGGRLEAEDSHHLDLRPLYGAINVALSRNQEWLKHIADRLSYYAKETNDPSLEPSALLKRLAAEGKTFASLAQQSKAA